MISEKSPLGRESTWHVLDNFPLLLQTHSHPSHLVYFSIRLARKGFVSKAWSVHAEGVRIWGVDTGVGDLAYGAWRVESQE